MFSIGNLSRSTGVKVNTIRYYEDAGLMPQAERTAGNQRRYTAAARDRLHFIAHSRALGLPLDAIRRLLELSDKGRDCTDAHEIAQDHLRDVRDRITRLRRLETELLRLSQTCDHAPGAPCGLIQALGDHDQCHGEH